MTLSRPHILVKNILQATRPRTFPLAFASILTGNALAYTSLTTNNASFSIENWGVFALSVWVALCLQILSNLANDYGDGVKGTDDLRDSNSPERMTATGQFNAQSFKKLIFVWAGFTFACGMGLIGIGLDTMTEYLSFLAMGIFAIICACAYTMGKRPYGYRAMGEVAVLVFFGWLGVLGSCYLQTNLLPTAITLNMWIVATGCGLLSACVLYVNNMRDVITDKLANKTTVAVLLSQSKSGQNNMAQGYFILLASSLICYLLYVIHTINNLPLLLALCLLALPIIIKHVIFIQKNQQHPEKIGTQLQVIVLINLLVSICFLINAYYGTK